MKIRETRKRDILTTTNKDIMKRENLKNIIQITMNTNHLRK